jgi:hypothetical protein
LDCAKAPWFDDRKVVCSNYSDTPSFIGGI